jgi:UDP-glucose 4-epimerase
LITEQLLSKSQVVIVIDNLSTGSLLNIEHLVNNKLLMFVKVDISDHNKILSFFKNIDWVFHITALAYIVSSIEDFLKYHYSNVNGTISVLEASRKKMLNGLYMLQHLLVKEYRIIILTVNLMEYALNIHTQQRNILGSNT